MWKNYKNFRLASYVWAYYLNKASEEQMQKDIDTFMAYAPLRKVYLENHRGLVEVPPEKIKQARTIFEKNGIEVSGGFTSTALVDGERKPSVFDTYCYTDERHRESYLKSIEDLASAVDEIILDDYFFTSCKCDKCIAAKGNRTWSEYRLDLLEEFSREMVARAKAVNPKLNFIIKYPAWHKSFHQTGYQPGKQKDIFDMIYTGTETREAIYNCQHLQRYHSYSILRLMENVAPDKNGGGWIDPGGSGDNINRFLEQAEVTMFAKAKELMVFNFEAVLRPDDYVLPALGKDLYRVDQICSQINNPVGVSVYEPYNSDGEDLVYNFLGMGGIAFEPVPYFDDQAPVIFLTESSAKDPDIINKLKMYVQNGGNAVITNGFLRATYDKGIKDITSVQLTGRLISGSEYMIGNKNYCNANYIVKGDGPVLFECFQHKDNATWCDVTVCCNENNSPILTEEEYGRGRFFVMNLPQNYADLYRLPEKVWETFAKHLSMGQRVYAAADGKFSFFAYDNDIYGVQNYMSHSITVRFVVRGECEGLKDIETGKVHDITIPLPVPSYAGDAASVIPEDPEFAIDVEVRPGKYNFFTVL